MPWVVRRRTHKHAKRTAHPEIFGYRHLVFDLLALSSIALHYRRLDVLSQTRRDDHFQGLTRSRYRRPPAHD